MRCTVSLLGVVDEDPEIENRGDGKALARLWVTTTESWRDQASGERRQRPTRHLVIVKQSGVAKAVARQVRKGALVDVVGTLAYEPGSKAGAEIHVRAPSHSILFVDPAEARNQAGS
jgi:single-stranded DNA-binding protein